VTRRTCADGGGEKERAVGEGEKEGSRCASEEKNEKAQVKMRAWASTGVKKGYK